MGLHTPPIPPIPISQKHPRHALRSSKSAQNIGNRSHGSTGHTPTAKIHSMGSSHRVLSVEDVLGELFKKEDALDSLRILAQTQIGLIDEVEDMSLSPERSTSRHNRRKKNRAGARSIRGTETSFLRMGPEEDDGDGSDAERPTDSRSTPHSVPFAPCLYPAPSTEVSVMYLDEDHSARHPYSGGIGPEHGRLLPSSDGSVTTKEKQVLLRSSLSYVHLKRENGCSAVLGSRSESTESCGDVLEQSVVSRSRPAQILISSVAHSDASSPPPTYSNSDLSPQLPKLVPPSPLSASFDRSFAFPSSAELILAVNQLTSGTEEVSSRHNRSSLVTDCTCAESVKSCTLSRRPGSFSTLAFGHSTSVRREKRSRESFVEETFDSESCNLNDWLGYEGDHNSATESSSEEELDFANYYRRRRSEDLYQSRADKSQAKLAKKRSQAARKSRMERDQQYLNEVEIIDMRTELRKRENAAPSNSHLFRSVEASGSQTGFDHEQQFVTTTKTITTTPDAVSPTLSSFHFVDEDPWTEREDEPRISISSTVYSRSYYDPYDVLPTPRTPQTFTHSQSDTMKRDRNNYTELEDDRISFMEMASPTVDKPLLPTTSKQDFPSFASAGRSRKASHSPERRIPNSDQGRRPAPKRKPVSHSYDDYILPPTSNHLDPLSRADLVRKSRKLAQVFGETPKGQILLPVLPSPARESFLDITSSRHRPSNSIAALAKSSSDPRDNVAETVQQVKGKAIWPPPAATQYISANSGRRHSTPLTPDEFDFLNELRRPESASSAPPESAASSVLDLSSGEGDELIEIGEEVASFIDFDEASPSGNGKRRSIHPVELLDLSPPGSQDSSRHTSLSSLTFASPSVYPHGAPRNAGINEEEIGMLLTSAASFDDIDDERYIGRSQALARQPSLMSIISPSLMSPEERIEAEKRRKRDKLAKLHRFLGSRVPTDLALGQTGEDSESGLPSEEIDTECSGEEKRSWKRMPRVTRRRSGSETGTSGEWSDVTDRRKEDLGEDERMRMVKRAMRLEKVFGVAPPQTLYHPQAHRIAYSSSGLITPPALHMMRPSSAGAVESLTAKTRRSPHSSRELLLPGKSERDVGVGNVSGPSARSGVIGRPRGASLVYTHYEHSLITLGDILDRDDRASLKELHEILYQPEDDEPEAAGVLFRPDNNQDMTSGDIESPEHTSGSTWLERRRSLPVRTSIASLGSMLSKVSFDDADVETNNGGAFQMRRRRAAKLKRFFGVDYRDLVRDVLDSIETGVELERGRGMIDVEEAEDLLKKLRTIKGKRTGVLQ